MLKLVAKSFLIILLITTTVFADEELSVFHRQGDIDYPEPKSESSYFAEVAPRPEKTSTYFGMNLGLGIISIEPKITLDGTSIITDVNEKSRAVNYGLGFYSGVGTNFDNFYLGGELSLALNLLNKKITAGTVEMSVKQPIVMGLDIIPGYLTQSGRHLFYGRLGIGSSLLKVNLKDSSSTFDNSTNRINFALRAGFGVEFLKSDLVSLRTEYVYTKYNSISDNGTTPMPYDYKLNGLSAHLINLGVALHF